MPAEYSSKPDQTGVSNTERYKEAYEGAWWTCVARFAKDIDYQPSEFDRAGNGWPAAVQGYDDGYRAAELRVHTIRNQYGPERAQAFLRSAAAERE